MMESTCKLTVKLTGVATVRRIRRRRTHCWLVSAPTSAEVNRGGVRVQRFVRRPWVVREQAIAWTTSFETPHIRAGTD